MEFLHLDAKTLADLEKDGFLIETRKTRHGAKLYQNVAQLESYSKPSQTKIINQKPLTTKNQPKMRKTE